MKSRIVRISRILLRRLAPGLALWAFLPLALYGQTDCAKQTQIPELECEALLQIHRDFGSFDQEGWNQDDEPCQWRGVLCTAGRVTTLNFTGQEIAGTLSPALGSFPALEALFVNDSNLVGPVPEEVAKLTSLTSLTFIQVDLQGPFPEVVTSLASLNSLRLDECRITGPMPSTMGNLVGLTRISLSGNELSGPLPRELGDLAGLEQLEASNNLLTALPEEISNLQGLRFLILNSNRLTTIPPELADLSALEILSLQNNQIVGDFPLDLLELPNLWFLNLTSNHLSGPLPEELQTLPFNLGVLGLAENHFTGPVLTGLAEGFLTFLDLRGNELVGEIPLEFASTNIRLLVDRNCLTATDPALRQFLAEHSEDWEETQCVSIFEDGFHTGDLSRWSGAVGQGAP